MNRQQRAQVAEETVDILKQGHYTTPEGEQVDIAAQVGAAVEGSELVRPEDGERLLADCEARLSERPRRDTHIEVNDETTLEAGRRLHKAGYESVVALNFASAKNPGGGFLGGSRAQEESLARSSALYPCINQMEGYYRSNRRSGTCLYTHHMIHSPDVPVIRYDDGRLLAEPWPLSIITAPAVNGGCIRDNEPEKEDRIESVMLERMERVLALAALNNHDALVLGAWGCGVFRLDPEDVSAWFGRFLLGEGRFAGAFEKVAFAVLDNSGDRRFIGPFERIFGAET